MLTVVLIAMILPMVRLDRIYTKSGDDGSTGLGDGQRLPKHHARIAAYGTTDELSSVIGVILAQGIEAPWDAQLRAVQNDLFDVGADLCVPSSDEDALRVTRAYSEDLEHQIDEVNESLKPLQSFILPGGATAAAWLHIARTVCRRAERHVSELEAMTPEEAAGPVNSEVLIYLNRLSDYLFVLARAVNSGGDDDVIWEPGARQR